MRNAKDLATQLRFIARREGGQVTEQDMKTLEAAAAELERLLEAVLFTHRMNSERART
jgi:hypothetical protein